jgi:hypothetical protein
MEPLSWWTKPIIINFIMVDDWLYDDNAFVLKTNSALIHVKENDAEISAAHHNYIFSQLTLTSGNLEPWICHWAIHCSSFSFWNTLYILSVTPQSLKLIIDPLVASFIPVTNAFIVLAIVISFCEYCPKIIPSFVLSSHRKFFFTFLFNSKMCSMVSDSDPLFQYRLYSGSKYISRRWSHRIWVFFSCICFSFPHRCRRNLVPKPVSLSSWYRLICWKGGLEEQNGKQSIYMSLNSRFWLCYWRIWNIIFWDSLLPSVWFSYEKAESSSSAITNRVVIIRLHSLLK